MFNELFEIYPLCILYMRHSREYFSMEISHLIGKYSYIYDCLLIKYMNMERNIIYRMNVEHYGDHVMH